MDIDSRSSSDRVVSSARAFGTFPKLFGPFLWQKIYWIYTHHWRHPRFFQSFIKVRNWIEDLNSENVVWQVVFEWHVSLFVFSMHFKTICNFWKQSIGIFYWQYGWTKQLCARKGRRASSSESCASKVVAPIRLILSWIPLLCFHLHPKQFLRWNIAKSLDQILFLLLKLRKLLLQC